MERHWFTNPLYGYDGVNTTVASGTEDLVTAGNGVSGGVMRNPLGDYAGLGKDVKGFEGEIYVVNVVVVGMWGWWREGRGISTEVVWMWMVKGGRAAVR